MFWAAPIVTECDRQGQGINLGKCLQLSDGRSIGEVYSSPAVLANLVVQNLLVIGGVLLFIYLFYAGFLAVTGGKKGFDQGVQMATQAGIGFIILFCAYWLVALLQMITGVSFGL